MNHDISDLLDAVPARVNGDATLARIGRHCTTEFMLEAGERSFHLGVERGRMREVLHGPRPLRAWTFALRAESEVWQRFWEPLPAPGYNDIFALSRCGHLRIDGDVAPLLTHLRFLKAVLALPRTMLAEQHT